MAKDNIIGKFEGECADSTITNNNGLDITREVWETLFNSEDFKQGIEQGWYLGRLGHPDDPNDQDHKDSCIVMTEGHIDDNGKVYGTFNLIDTPTGRIVKTLIDAGVTFGISVRGAGDIINNSVDPDTFVFRGFDLVTFPAYPEAIPEFTAIAASSNLEEQKKYKKICAAVENELESIDSISTLEQLQPYFPKQSDTHAKLEERLSNLKDAEEQSIIDSHNNLKELDERIELLEKQNSGLLDLLLEAKQEVATAYKLLDKIKQEANSSNIFTSKKVTVLQRICANQNKLLLDMQKAYEKDKKRSILANKRIKKAYLKLKQINLQSQQKIEAAENKLIQKEQVIASLQTELNETVNKFNVASKELSNLERKSANLDRRIQAAESLLSEYQVAYASMYSKAVGVDPSSVSITASTSVDSLRKSINAVSTMPSASYSEPQSEYEEIFETDETSLISL